MGKIARNNFFPDIKKKGFKKVEVFGMKFDFCIGNPPYQETKGGTKNIDVWPAFIDGANTIAGSSCLIHPGRWLQPKKQMEETHKHILESGLVGFKYYPNAANVFNGVAIDGGLTVTMFKNGYNGAPTYSVNDENKGIYNDAEKFFSDEYEEEAYNKIFIAMQSNSIRPRILGNIGCLGGSEFGYHKHTQINELKKNHSQMTEPIRIWANASYGKGSRFDWYFIEKDRLKNPPEKLLSSRKVMIDKKGHSLVHGRGNIINNLPKIVDKNVTASGDVLFVFPENDTDYELNLIRSFFMTKTVRFLMSITQKDLYVRGFENVPDYTVFIPLLDGKLFSDAFFYKTFGLSDSLIEHIESCVSPKCEV